MLCAIAPGQRLVQRRQRRPADARRRHARRARQLGAGGCAPSPTGRPGVYTELAEPTIAASSATSRPTRPTRRRSRPRRPRSPATAKSGETLTCQPGSWTSDAPGAPEIDFRFAHGRRPDRSSGWSSIRDATADRGERRRPARRLRRARPRRLGRVRRRVGADRRRRRAAAGRRAAGHAADADAPPTPRPRPRSRSTRSPRARPSSRSAARRRGAARCACARPTRGTPVSGVRTVRVTLLPARGRTRTVTARKIAHGLYEARFTQRRARQRLVHGRDARPSPATASPQPAIRRVRVR